MRGGAHGWYSGLLSFSSGGLSSSSSSSATCGPVRVQRGRGRQLTPAASSAAFLSITDGLFAVMRCNFLSNTQTTGHDALRVHCDVVRVDSEASRQAQDQ